MHYPAMTTTAAAIYEHGVLRPLAPLPLVEGSRVEVTVTDDVLPGCVRDGVGANDLLGAVASLPMESDAICFSGREHDRILYGDPGRAS